MPILWDEPFGIVMAEAMACGTPVIGMARGAVPEVVQNEVTGFVADRLDELVEAVGRLPEINRARAARGSSVSFPRLRWSMDTSRSMAK